MKKYLKILIYILNSIAGIVFLFSLCNVGAPTAPAVLMLVISGLWLVGYGIVHDRQTEKEERKDASGLQ